MGILLSRRLPAIRSIVLRMLTGPQSQDKGLQKAISSESLVLDLEMTVEERKPAAAARSGDEARGSFPTFNPCFTMYPLSCLV